MNDFQVARSAGVDRPLGWVYPGAHLVICNYMLLVGTKFTYELITVA